eukprot:m51a1_g8476 hypothetical protein (937) ;mRNA; r:503405-507339
MFEGLLSDLLQRFLGEYVQDLNKEQLNLKGEALDSLNLPITVKHGVLGKLELSVPWKNLSSKPVIVSIDHVFLLAVPRSSFTYDEQRDKESARNAKLKKLAQYELAKSLKEQDGASSSGSGGGLASRIAMKVIDNLQVRVGKVHVRYEDASLELKQKMALGATLEGLTLLSANNGWEPAFVEGLAPTELRNKIVELKSLSLYLDPAAEPLGLLAPEQLFQALEGLIPTATGPASPLQKKLVLKPVCANLRATLCVESGRYDVPRAVADAVIPNISLALEEEQLRAALHVAATMAEYGQAIKYIKYRPTVRPAKGGAAAQWWRFAITVVLEEVRSRRQRTSYVFLLERRKMRQLYINLFKRTLGAKWVRHPEAVLVEEAKNAEKLEEYKKTKKAEKKASSSWFSWGSKKQSTEEKSEEPEPTIELSQEQQQRVYELVGYDSSSTIEIVPKEYVQFKVNLDLKELSLDLIGSKSGEGSLVKGALQSINVGVVQRPANLTVDLGVKSFSIVDSYTPGSCYKAMLTTVPRDAGAPFLEVGLDLNPMDGHADTAVKVKMSSMEVVICKPLIDRMSDFFVPKDELDLTTMKSLASDQLKNIVKASRVQLEIAAQNHKRLDLEVVVEAPCVIIPLHSDRADSTALVADLGLFNVNSVLSPKRTKEQSLTTDDFYDKYVLALQNMQVLLVENTSSRIWKDPNHAKRANLIDPLSLGVTVKSCIQGSEIVEAELPNLSCTMTLEKFGLVMELVSVLIAPLPVNPTTTIKSQSQTTLLKHVAEVDTPVVVHANETAKDESTLKGILLAKKALEGRFIIQKVSLTVAETAQDGQEDRPIVSATLEGIDCSLVKRTWDMSIRTTLHEFIIQDCVAKESGYPMPYLASSRNDVTDTHTKDLITVNLKMTDPDSPEYQRVQLAIDAQLTSFYVMCNPTTVAHLILMSKQM